jgi:uncharacterized protein (TIGR03083 family)
VFDPVGNTPTVPYAGGMDVRDRFTLAAGSFAALVHEVPDDAYDGPGLGEWDLRALVGHASRSLVTVLTYLDRPSPDAATLSAVDYYAHGVLAATDPAAVVERGRAAGAALGDDPAAALDTLVTSVAERLPSFEDGYVLETIAGPMRLGDYLPTRTFELVVHGLDVARSTGLVASYDEDVLAEAAGLAARIAARTGSGVDVLLALTGRTSLPEGFSVI